MPEDIAEETSEESADPGLVHLSNPDNNNLTPPQSRNEHLLNEERASRKRPKRNEKYNKSFDMAKTFTDILPQFDNECFDSNLEFCYGVVKLLRSGVPKELFEYVANPTAYELKILPKSDAPSSHSSQSAAEPTTVTSSSSSLSSIPLSSSSSLPWPTLFRRLPYYLQLTQLRRYQTDVRTK